MGRSEIRDLKFGQYASKYQSPNLQSPVTSYQLPITKPTRSLRLMIVLAAIAYFGSGCGATVTPPPPVFLKVAGSTSVEPLFTLLSDAYSREYPHVSFDIEGGGSGLGQAMVESGEADIGMVSWPPSNLNSQFRLAPIGRDGVAIIVHPDNEISGLSMIDLRRIFSGEILEWQAVGSAGRSIQVVSREDGSGTRAAFETMVMADEAVTSTAIVLPNGQAVIDFVTDNPTAIGYVSSALIDRRVRTVPVEGVLPTLESLDAYPLGRDLALIVPEPGSAEIDRLLKFIASPAGRQIVSQRWGLSR